MSGCPHTDFRSGQRIIMTFTDGSRAVDKFIERKSGVIVTRNLGRVPVKKLRATTIYRGQQR